MEAHMRTAILAAVCAALLGSQPSPVAQTPASHYRIANRFALDGDGGWDYLAVDESAGRLFVSHGTLVQVVDEKTGKVLGAIPDTKGVHGIAIAGDLNKGFTSNGRDTSVIMFDLKTLAVLSKVTVTGSNPDAIIYEPVSHMVFAFNRSSSNATAIDAKTGKVAATIALDGGPEFSAVDGKGNVFVNIEDKSLLCRIDAKTLKVVDKWPLAPGESPSGLAIDAAGHRLFSVCHNKLMIVVDAQSGKVVASLPIGERVDGAGFDPVNKRAYSSNGDGTLTVVQDEGKDKYTVLENVVTQKGARTMVVDARTHHVFLPTAEYGPAPEATADNPHPRPVVKPGSFVLLDVEPLK
jgi:DNA-binding beta-propeller fold protein YncE